MSKSPSILFNKIMNQNISDKKVIIVIEAERKMKENVLETREQ